MEGAQSVPVSEQTTTTTAQTKSRRIGAIDKVRGYAMIAMLIGHSTRRIPDLHFRVAYGWDAKASLAITMTTLQEWIAFIIHMATPTFFVLAGFSLALFEASRLRRGWSQMQITRFLFIRGAVLIFIDFAILSWDVYPSLEYAPYLGFVLLAIGLCIWSIALMRLLSLRTLAIIAFVLAAGMQILYHLTSVPTDYNVLRSVFLYPGPEDPVLFDFPVLGWLPVMLLGFICGKIISQRPEIFTQLLTRVGIVLMLIWAVVIVFNDFGVLYPDHRLIFTKHPPGLDFLSFYLGVTFLLMALHQRVVYLRESRLFDWLLVIGQTALFFYIVHTYVLSVVGLVLSKFVTFPDVAQALVTSAISLVIVFFMCLYYRRLRRAHPNSILRFL